MRDGAVGGLFLGSNIIDLTHQRLSRSNESIARVDGVVKRLKM
jgi:hypothetical protein